MATKKLQPSMIGIYGATGFTGSLIAQILDTKQVPFLLAGRDEDKLRAISQRLPTKPQYIAANVSEFRELQAFCSQCSVVINCVGPFLRWSEPVVAAALEQDCHYLDISAEQPFVKLVHDRYHKIALSRELCVVSGAGFESAVSDLHLSRYELEFDKVSSLKVAYIKTGPALRSVGSRLSILDMMRTCQGWYYQDGAWKIEPSSYKRSKTEFNGESLVLTHYPGVDTIHAPLSLPSLQKVDTYANGLPPKYVVEAAQLIIEIPRIAHLIQKHILSGVRGPTEQQRHQRKFTILHKVSGDQGEQQVTKYYEISGWDPYGLTSQCVAEMAERLYRGLYHHVGVCSPASAFDATSFVEQLQTWGVTTTLLAHPNNGNW